MNWYELIWYDTMSYCYIHAQLNDSKYMSTWCDFWTFLDLSAVNVSCWDGLQWREEPERFWRHGCLSRAAAPSGANLHLGKVDWWWGPQVTDLRDFGPIIFWFLCFSSKLCVSFCFHPQTWSLSPRGPPTTWWMNGGFSNLDDLRLAPVDLVSCCFFGLL